MSACWADKQGPGAAVRKPSKGYSNGLFDVPELKRQSRGLGRNDIQRPQARNGNGWQIVTVSGYHTKLDITPGRTKAHPAPRQYDERQAASRASYSETSRHAGAHGAGAAEAGFGKMERRKRLEAALARAEFVVAQHQLAELTKGCK